MIKMINIKVKKKVEDEDVGKMRRISLKKNKKMMT